MIDWVSVLVSGLYGGVVCALGWSIGLFLARAEPEKKRRNRVALICGLVALALSFPLERFTIGPYLAQRQVERELAVWSLVYPVLKQHYPHHYGRAMAQLRDAVRNRHGEHQTATAIRSTVRGALQQALPAANEMNTLLMMRLIRDEGGALQARSAVECGRFLTQGSTSLDLPTVFGRELAGRDMAMTAMTLEQAATTPHRWPIAKIDGDLEALTLRALDRVPSEDHAYVEGWSAGGRSSEELAAGCLYSLALLDELLALPRSEGAAAFQALNAAGAIA